MIKKTIFIAIISSILFSCDKVAEFTEFDIDYQSNITIPSSVGINVPLDITTPQIESNSSSTFEENNTSEDLVDEIKLSSLTMTITSPSSADFSFLESIDIYLSSEGLDDIKLAWKDPVPSSTGVTLTLETTDVDMKEHIFNDTFTLKVTSVTDELITQDHHIEVNSIFTVDAQILGL